MFGEFYLLSETGCKFKYMYSNFKPYICYDAAPFKFDVPSPDDLVSNGLHSSKTRSKGILLTCLNFCRNQFLRTLMHYQTTRELEDVFFACDFIDLGTV